MSTVIFQIFFFTNCLLIFFKLHYIQFTYNILSLGCYRLLVQFLVSAGAGSVPVTASWWHSVALAAALLARLLPPDYMACLKYILSFLNNLGNK